MGILVASVYTLMISKVLMDTASAIQNISDNNKLLKEMDEAIKMCATPHRQKQLAEAVLGKCQIQGA